MALTAQALQVVGDALADYIVVSAGLGQRFRWFWNHVQEIHRPYARRVSLDVAA
jgi:hypothetical protein